MCLRRKVCTGLFHFRENSSHDVEFHLDATAVIILVSSGHFECALYGNDEWIMQEWRAKETHPVLVELSVSKAVGTAELIFRSLLERVKTH